MVEMVRMRLTKALLRVMEQVDVKGEGIMKYSKKDIYGIVYGKLENRISVVDYCLVNGYYDMHKLLSSFYNNHY